MADFYSLREAMFVTAFPVAAQVYASSWEADQMAEFLRFRSVTDGSATVTYMRRKTGDKISAEWITPGQVLAASADPKLVEIAVRLRSMVKQPKIPSHLRQNYNNGTLTRDPLLKKVFMTLRDVARDIWQTSVTGLYIDTAVLLAGGGLTAAHLGTITPGPYNDPQRGYGALKFVKATMKMSYRCPGDNDFGDEVVVANGTKVTLRSAHVAGYVTLTPVALPATDGHTEVEFSSTSKQPDGLDNLIDPSMIITNAAPVATNFRQLDEMLTKLNPAYRDSPGTCYIFNSEQINALEDRARAFGGAKLDDVSFGNDEVGLPDFLGMAERKVRAYKGHPILCNDRIPAVVLGGKSTHAGYCVCLDPNVMEDAENDGGAFTGITRGAPEGAVLGGAYGLGFSLEDLGTLQNETSSAMRLTWEGAWELGSSGAASKITGLFDPF